MLSDFKKEACLEFSISNGNFYLFFGGNIFYLFSTEISSPAPPRSGDSVGVRRSGLPGTPGICRGCSTKQDLSRSGNINVGHYGGHGGLWWFMVAYDGLVCGFMVIMV